MFAAKNKYFCFNDRVLIIFKTLIFPEVTRISFSFIIKLKWLQTDDYFFNLLYGSSIISSNCYFPLRQTQVRYRENFSNLLTVSRIRSSDEFNKFSKPFSMLIPTKSLKKGCLIPNIWMRRFPTLNPTLFNHPIPDKIAL